MRGYCDQNPRWTQKPLIHLCLHTILGSHYYVPRKMAIQLEYPHLVQIMEPRTVPECLRFCSQICHFCSSRLKPREQPRSRFLESMPRVTRSLPTPTPPAEAVPTLGKAPVSASPLAMPVATAPVSASPSTMPDPNPSRVLAFYVEPQTPLEDLPCFMPCLLYTSDAADE